MTTRRQLLVGLGTALLALPLRSFAQKPGKMWRVGFLSARKRPQSLESDYHGGFPRGLRDLGYVEGSNLQIEWRYADGNYDRLPALAAELVALHVDVIVTADGTPPTLAAKNATSTIPIVFAASGDPVGSGLVASLAHPGGNITGISLLLFDSIGKQLEFLKTIVPKLVRLAVLYNPNNRSAGVLEKLEAAARLKKIETVRFPVQTPQEIEIAFPGIMDAHANAITCMVDGFLIQQHHQVAELAMKHRLPSVGGLREFAKEGGLMSYGPSRAANYRRVATFVDKILKGASPAELPVEQPTKLELVMNRKAAKALGLDIPAELLVLADEVIE